MDRVFSFLLWPKRGARGPWKQGRKKRGSITCRTDRANEANKMFIILLCWLFRFWNGDRELEVRTATYGPGIDQSQHAKSVSHIINVLRERERGRAIGKGTLAPCSGDFGYIFQGRLWLVGLLPLWKGTFATFSGTSITFSGALVTFTGALVTFPGTLVTFSGSLVSS